MAEIGLGEAIAGGTNLSGEFGSPITRALATREQNELRRLQMEEARAAKQRAASEKVARFMTQDDGKWYNPKNAEEFRKEYEMELPNMITADKSGDNLTLAKSQMKVKNRLTYYKAKDEQEKEIKTLMPKFETARIADRILREKGQAGIQEEMDMYPVPAAYIDENGITRVTRIPKLDISKGIDRYVKQIAESAKLKKATGPSGIDVYETDLNDPAIKDAKETMVKFYLDNPDYMQSIMVGEDFRKFFNDYVKANGGDREYYLNEGLGEVQKEFIGKSFDTKFQPKQRAYKQSTGRSPSSRPKGPGSGSYSRKWNFNDDKDGYTLIQTTGTGMPTLGFPIVKNNGGEELVKIQTPKAVYDPIKGKFIVKGFDSEYNTSITIEVTPEMMMNQFDMSEQELAREFKSYKPKAAPRLNTGSKNAPRTTVKPR